MVSSLWWFEPLVSGSLLFGVLVSPEECRNSTHVVITSEKVRGFCALARQWIHVHTSVHWAFSEIHTFLDKGGLGYIFLRAPRFWQSRPRSTGFISTISRVKVDSLGDDYMKMFRILHASFNTRFGSCVSHGGFRCVKAVAWMWDILSCLPVSGSHLFGVFVA